MGGRGASSGISNKGKPYGSQYKTVLKSGNIKFVTPKVDNPEPLVETMTKGRVYVLLNSQNEPSSIMYYDSELKRKKTVDLRHYHAKMKPIPITAIGTQNMTAQRAQQHRRHKKDKWLTWYLTSGTISISKRSIGAVRGDSRSPECKSGRLF